MSKFRSPATVGAALLLAAFTVAVWLPVRDNDFVTYDDPVYVTENAHVQSGITKDGLIWALTDTSTGNWHPVTWLSHMLDCELFHLRSGSHHLVSLALHAANVCLLFLLLAAMTRSLGRSAFVAAAFAIHPLHVESVAWIAERKDLLAAFFGLLAILAWLRWLSRPRPGGYLLVGVFHALSLASKPMLVTLPVVLLLLDVWPLHRLEPPHALPSDARASAPGVFSAGAAALARWLRRALPLITEKAPLFALSLVFCVIALLTQHRSGSVASLESIGIGLRIENAAVSYVLYLRDALLPRKLTVLYPYPDRGYPVVVVLACVLFLALATVTAMRAARTRPWLMVGWTWYVVTLLPVIGLVQIGVQARADRYTYLPLIGPFLMIAWTVPELVAARSPRRLALAVSLGAAVILTWAVMTRAQLGYWKDSTSLYTRALFLEPHNPEIQYNLADALAETGALREAVVRYRAALRDDPDYAEAHNNLGNALRRLGRAEEATAEYRSALAIDARSALVHNNLGLVLAEQDKLEEAVVHYVEALRLDPSYTGARRNLGRALHRLGRLDDAETELRAVVREEPRDPDAAYGLANVLVSQGRTVEAVADYQRALQIRPRHAATHMRLAVALGLLGRSEEAHGHYCAAIEIDPTAERLVGGKLNVLPSGERVERVLQVVRGPCGASPSASPPVPLEP